LLADHGGNNPDSLLVKLEWEEFTEGIKLDGADKVWWDYRPLFRTKNARWRMAMVLLISIFGQFSGNGLGYFNVGPPSPLARWSTSSSFPADCSVACLRPQTVIYRNLGYTSSVTQLGFNLLNQCLSAMAAVTAAGFSDTIPRRKALIIGTFVCSLCLFGNASLSLVWSRQAKDAAGEFINPNLAIGQASLAFYFLFNIVFSFAYTPLQGVYPAENLESTARAKGMSMSGVIVSAIGAPPRHDAKRSHQSADRTTSPLPSAGFINAFAGPIALKNIANNYVWVFCGCVSPPRSPLLADDTPADGSARSQGTSSRRPSGTSSASRRKAARCVSLHPCDVRAQRNRLLTSSFASSSRSSTRSTRRPTRSPPRSGWPRSPSRRRMARWPPSRRSSDPPSFAHFSPPLPLFPSLQSGLPVARSLSPPPPPPHPSPLTTVLCLYDVFACNAPDPAAIVR